MTPNPFATRFTTPGRLPYLADSGLCVRLHGAWVNHGRTGAILGPHGCGKSTLLVTLAEEWTRAHGYRVTQVALHDGERTLPASIEAQAICEQDLLIIDGYEQLGWRARWALQRIRRRTSCGLLVTAHEELRLPTLHRVVPDKATFLAVVRRLLESADDTPRVASFLAQQAPAAWLATHGNAREALFGLYDRWEEAAAEACTTKL